MTSKYQRMIKIIQEIGSTETRVKYTYTLDSDLLNRVESAFTHGESTQLKDPEKMERTVRSLERLSGNFYKNKYPVDKIATFTELPASGAGSLTSMIDQLLLETAERDESKEGSESRFTFFKTPKKATT